MTAYCYLLSLNNWSW